MKGRAYKGFLWVDAEDLTRKRDLDFWIELCLDFKVVNPYYEISYLILAAIHGDSC